MPTPHLSHPSPCPLRFDIEPDITRASTLPAGVYGDPAYWQWSRRQIFARSWQLVGHKDLVKVPQQCHPFVLLDGCIDEPLLLTRDAADQIHCMSNVCTHRGTLVVEGPCVTPTLRCRYHGRKFGLDGRFQSMPEFGQAADFPSERDNLPKVQLREWAGFLFASLDPAMPFDEWIGPVQQRVGWLPFDEYRFDAGRSRDYLVNANWALYCDNYLEGFHIPFVHAALNQALDYGSYRSQLFRWCNLQLGVTRGGEHSFAVPDGWPDAGGQPVAAWYFWMWPNLMLNFYPWGLSINVVRPIAADRTRVSFLTYVHDERKLDVGAGAGLDRVEREDEEVVESVQIGVRSSLYQRGRYSPTREQNVHHFHRLLAEVSA
ncbi:MAG: aromatic ring-hydroxylating dioxygenase subunit alpha [Planctomycetota bacterium]